ncbi:MAG: hypothetical protein ABEH58_06820, partial [Haloplanus sp.]
GLEPEGIDCPNPMVGFPRLQAREEVNETVGEASDLFWPARLPSQLLGLVVVLPMVLRVLDRV